MKFNYKTAYPTPRPIIPILLKHNGLEVGYHVLVDSGADICLFDANIAEKIGVDIKKGKVAEILGVGGKMSVIYMHTITIEVGGWPCTIEVGFLKETELRSVEYGIVGQRGFFENFVVKFDLLKEEIDLKRREK